MRADSQSELTQLRELVSTLQAALEASQTENALLRQKVDALVRRVFGASSEAIDPAQLELLLQLSTPPSAAAPPQRPPQTRASRSVKESSPRLPEHLPVVEQVLDPEPVKAQPEQWRCIGQEISEQLDYEPGRFLRRRVIRRKYVHRTQTDRAPIIAPLPASLRERGLAAPGLLAQVLVSKYCDHLPLYRQEQIFARRHQVHLPRQTLARWVELCADWLKPIYETIRTGVMAGGYVQIDETPIEYLAPGNGQTKPGYLWTAHRPRGDVLYRWETSRAAACLDHLVPVDFTGTIQCDGYPGYGAFVDRRATPITLAGCWAHVRRKFHDALEQTPRTAGWLLRQIQHLYRVEAQLREHRAGPRLRAAIRAHQSCFIVERLKKALVKLKTSGRHLPQSLLGQAIDYALGQWPTLEVFLNDGRVEIDNNLVENAIRPTAIGKKNWLFIGDAEAGERSAIIYTVIESCRRRGIDPYTYLRDVLTRLPNLTNWADPPSDARSLGQSPPSPSHRQGVIGVVADRVTTSTTPGESPCQEVLRVTLTIKLTKATLIAPLSKYPEEPAQSGLRGHAFDLQNLRQERIGTQMRNACELVGSGNDPGHKTQSNLRRRQRIRAGRLVWQHPLQELRKLLFEQVARQTEHPGQRT